MCKMSFSLAGWFDSYLAPMSEMKASNITKKDEGYFKNKNNYPHKPFKTFYNLFTELYR